MDNHGKIQAFYLWLGIVYLNRVPPHDPNEGTRAEDDPVLVLQFTKDYEAGAWRKLRRGLTLEETALMFELSNGHRFMTLINSDGPQQSTSRIKRKLVLSSEGILELLTVHFRLKAGRKRHPSALMYYDAKGQTGHTINLLDADGSGELFAYWDPWPGRSLLCEENNKAGVKAQPLEGQRGWQVTRNELRGILMATLLDIEDYEAVLLSWNSADFPVHLRNELRRAMIAAAENKPE
jgi:hypothetical protein